MMSGADAETDIREFKNSDIDKYRLLILYMQKSTFFDNIENWQDMTFCMDLLTNNQWKSIGFNTTKDYPIATSAATCLWWWNLSEFEIVRLAVQ